jgi:hypothetical protein
MADESQDVPGHVPPEPGVESAPESEIPVGVDALTDEQIQKAEEAGPADGGGDEGDSGALDVSALMDDSGDAGEAGDADADAGDADAGGDAEATPDDDTGGADAATEEA